MSAAVTQAAADRLPGRRGVRRRSARSCCCRWSMSVLASVKPTAEAAASPPTYVPHGLSLDSYQRLWTYQAGLPTYLFNSLGTALLTIVFTLAADRARRRTRWPGSPCRARRSSSSSCCSR